MLLSSLKYSSVSTMNLLPFIEKALKCPQHSTQVSLRKVSSPLRREFAGTSMYIQYSCRKLPLTRIVNNLVGIGTGNPEGFRPGCFCRHFTRWFFIAVLPYSPLQ